MKALKEYIIHFGNLKPGNHQYEFLVDDSFFAEFDFSLVKHGSVKVDLTLEKQSEIFFTLHFTLHGTIELNCDRCLDPFNYPIDSKERILVKLEGKQETAADDELIFLPGDAYEIDVSPFIYEFINLAIPLRRICEVVGKACNPEMIERLQRLKPAEDAENDPRWSALKNLKKDQQ